MSLLSRINSLLPETKGTQPNGLLRTTQPLPMIFDNSRVIGNEVTLYTHKDGQNIIDRGYNINGAVHTCLNIIMKMFGKVPFYVVAIKKDEQKTFRDSQILIKSIHDPKAIAEAKKMRRKSIDGIILDNALSKFLEKPNRNQSGVMFREMLIGYKKLTGEGNQWFNRGVEDGRQRTDQPPMEMFIIPKYVLQLVGNQVDPWEIIRYQLTLNNGQTVQVPKENLLMWIEANFNFDGVSLSHLRGQPPLEAALLNIQALNEGAIREIKEAVNGGANGLLFRKDAKDLPKDPGTISSLRGQINSAVNGGDVAGTIAWMAGEWGYLPFGKTSQELQRIELSQANIAMICNVLGVPPGLLFIDQKYENATAFWKRLVYGVIAPEAYSLRDAWNGSLLEMFGMDRNRFAIDCDVLALPELATDLKEQVAAVKDAGWLSQNEKRIATGYEPAEGEEYDKVPVDDNALDLGGNFNREEEELNNI